MELLNGDLSKNELISWISLITLAWSLWFTWFPLALVVTLYIGWFVWQQFFDAKWIDTRGKVVYITGCDSGFGHAAAIELADAGFTVCAGCLNPENCPDLARDRSIHVLDLDVSNQEKVAKCAAEVKKLCGGGGLWALYNNAGFATAGEVEWIPMELYQRQMDVNLFGSVRVTQSVLPLIRRAKGRVVTVTTALGSASGRSPYSMSKAALESFMECLRYEMEKFGVKCCVIQPGNFTGTTKVFAGVAEQVSRICAAMPQDIKQAYGEKYLEKFSKATVQNYSRRNGPGSASIEPVLKNIKHAIMSEHPRIRYKPAQLGWLIWLFCHDVLPETLTHLYITKWHLRHFPKPTEVEMEA